MRVLVLFCEEGDGHASAARVLARELESAGAEVVVADAMRGGLGRLIPLVARDAYHVQVDWLRWSYGIEYWLFTRFPPTRWLGRRGLAGFGGRPLLRLIRRSRADVVVSTHPAVTNILGHLRRGGRLRVPAVATVTDFGVHALWAHRGVDLHLVMHDTAVPAVERVAGRESAAVVAPIVAPEFGATRDRAAARRALGLPPERPVVLVSGGGWGVGELERTAAAALELEDATVVCLSGRSELVRQRLERRFAGEPRLRVVPFTDRMPEYLAAAEVLVDASVGVTCLEALQAGCAVVACGMPPGHSRENARALARLGLATAVSSPERLAPVLAGLVGAEPAAAALPAGPRASAAILAAQTRVVPRTGHRRLALAAAGASLSALVLAGWTFASPTPYPVVAKMLDLDPLTQVATQTRDVAVVVAASPQQVPRLERRLARDGLRVSFAITDPLSRAEQQRLAERGEGLLPVLRPGANGLLHARTQLARMRRSLHLGPRFYYLAPRGFSLGDYVAARSAGGHPVAGSRRLGAGCVIVLDARAGYDGRAIDALASSLAARGMRAVPLSELLASSTRPTGSAAASRSTPARVATRPLTSPASRSGDEGQPSPASTGASATGSAAVSAKTSGAT